MRASRRCCSTSSPTWSSSAGSARNTLTAYRTDLLQYGAFLARPRGSRPPRRRRRRLRLPRRARHRQRPAALLARRRSTARPPACAPSTATCAAGADRGDPTATWPAAEGPELPKVLSYGEVKKLLERSAGDRSGRPARPGDARGHVRLRAARVRDDRARGRLVDLRRGFVRAHGKGSKERIVPLGREAAPRSAATCAPGRAELVGAARRAHALRQPARRAADPPGALQDHPAATPATPG